VLFEQEAFAGHHLNGLTLINLTVFGALKTPAWNRFALISGWPAKSKLFLDVATAESRTKETETLRNWN
jgi:hypothetical protein